MKIFSLVFKLINYQMKHFSNENNYKTLTLLKTISIKTESYKKRIWEGILSHSKEKKSPFHHIAIGLKDI